MDLNITTFRANFPLYADETTYTDMTLESEYEIGKCFIADNDCTFPEKCREYALQLMLAHLTYCSDESNAGNNSGVIQSANEGDVSVSFAVPDISDPWHNWMNLSPFGKKLLAMLSAQSVGGFYVGGLPERKGFRKIGGVF